MWITEVRIRNDSDGLGCPPEGFTTRTGNLVRRPTARVMQRADRSAGHSLCAEWQHCPRDVIRVTGTFDATAEQITLPPRPPVGVVRGCPAVVPRETRSSRGATQIHQAGDNPARDADRIAGPLQHGVRLPSASSWREGATGSGRVAALHAWQADRGSRAFRGSPDLPPQTPLFLCCSSDIGEISNRGQPLPRVVANTSARGLAYGPWRRPGLTWSSGNKGSCAMAGSVNKVILIGNLGKGPGGADLAVGNEGSEFYRRHQ